ncbi:MAG TPA: hypothetical protein VEH50_12140 [Methylomirabilota bacterium]|nr:hypothetical protein [Methylomirabilota bacterium]
MNNRWIRKVLLVSVLAGVGLAVACGANPEGTYRDPDGAVRLQLKSGKASLDVGPLHLDAAYKVDGDKLTLTPLQGDTRQTIVFTIDKDGSLEGPPDSMFPKLLRQR